MVRRAIGEFASIQQEVRGIKSSVDQLIKDVDRLDKRVDHCVTKAQFDPVYIIVYRTLGIIVGAIVLGAATLILSKGWNLLLP